MTKIFPRQSFFIFLTLLLIFLTVSSRSEYDNSEYCDGCGAAPHCELKHPWIAVVCDVLTTKKACENVNGCVWVE